LYLHKSFLQKNLCKYNQLIHLQKKTSNNFLLRDNFLLRNKFFDVLDDLNRVHQLMRSRLVTGKQ